MDGMSDTQQPISDEAAAFQADYSSVDGEWIFRHAAMSKIAELEARLQTIEADTLAKVRERVGAYANEVYDMDGTVRRILKELDEI
jgi:hypothetical protein